MGRVGGRGRTGEEVISFVAKMFLFTPIDVVINPTPVFVETNGRLLGNCGYLSHREIAFNSQSAF